MPNPDPEIDPPDAERIKQIIEDAADHSTLTRKDLEEEADEIDEDGLTQDVH